MALIDIIRNGIFTMGVWRVEENEAQLKERVGGTFFPGLEKISHPRRRLEWLCARCLIQEFGYNSLVKYHPTRRPFLAYSKAHLSITHSYPLVSVIVSPNHYVGIDVESFSRPFSHVAHKYLSLREMKWVDVHDSRRMSLIWSAKEALYKLPGMDGLCGADMNVRPITEISDRGNLTASVKVGGSVQQFSLQYTFVGHFNVVWVCFNPTSIIL
jgi:phosphopantetheinyl transferase (holo-ACP synthase)